MIADEFIKNIEKTLSDPEKLKKFADVLIENLPDLLSKISQTLEDQYNYSDPHVAWWLISYPLTFNELRFEVVGTRSFVLEIGMFRGGWYRIRERKNIYPMLYFVWADCSNEQQAIDHWEGFIALAKAKEIVQQAVLSGKKKLLLRDLID